MPGVELHAQGELDNGGQIYLSGWSGTPAPGTTITEPGVISVGSSGLKLAGSGYVSLYSEGAPAEIVSDGAPASFENVSNTIYGAGQIGDALLTVQNDANGTIYADQGSGQTLLVAPDGLFTNSGTAELDYGAVLQIGQSGANSWTNNGQISSYYGEIILDGPFTNTGSISAQGGSLDLIGSFDNEGSISVTKRSASPRRRRSLADVGTVQLTNSNVYLNGTMDLNGQTLDTTSGELKNLTVDGGTIENGVVLDGQGGTLNFSWNSNNDLSGMRVIGEDPATGGVVINGGDVTFSNGTSVLDKSGINPAPITINYANVDFDGYSDLTNTVTLNGGGLSFGGSMIPSPINTDSGNLGDGPPIRAGRWTSPGNPPPFFTSIVSQADSSAGQRDVRLDRRRGQTIRAGCALHLHHDLHGGRGARRSLAWSPSTTSARSPSTGRRSCRTSTPMERRSCSTPRTA